MAILLVHLLRWMKKELFGKGQTWHIKTLIFIAVWVNWVKTYRAIKSFKILHRYTTWVDDHTHTKEYEILDTATWQLVVKPAGLIIKQKTLVPGANVCHGESGYVVSDKFKWKSTSGNWNLLTTILFKW